MSEEPESQCPNCEKLWERIGKLEAEKEKLQKTQKAQFVGICVLVALIIVRLLLSIATQ